MTIHTWGFPQTPVIKPPRPVYVSKVTAMTSIAPPSLIDIQEWRRLVARLWLVA